MKHNRLFTYILLAFVIFSISQISFEELTVGLSLLIFLGVYVYTDLLSGVLHIILDNERSLDIPVLRSLAKGFQQHHRDPNSIYEMDLYNHLYTMHLPLVMAFPFVLLLNFSLVYFVYINFVVSLHLMQMAHRWAHLPKSRINPVVRIFQNGALLVSRKTHLGHHNGVYDENFCIMNGWFNKPLNLAVQKFGRTSHGWVVVFLILVSLTFIVPALIFMP